MPSVQVTSKEWNSEVKKDDRIAQQTLEKVGTCKAEHPIKMPCNPSTPSQSPPPTDGELHTNHHGNSIQSNGSTVEEGKSKMAKKAYMYPSVDKHVQPDDPKTSSAELEDLKASVDTKPRQASKTGPKKNKPKSFDLLYKEVVQVHGRLEKQRNVTTSYEKETHVLTHTVSAPGALSDCKEPPLEDQVFADEETREKKNGDQSKKVDVETKPQEQMKKDSVGNNRGQKDCTEARNDEKLHVDVGKDDGRQEHPEKSSSDDEPQADKVDAGVREATEEVSSDAGDKKKKEKEKDEEEVKKTVGDIDSLTQSLQSNLQLDDDKKAEKSKTKGEVVSNLANDIQSMSLGDKAAAPASGRPVLRARGIQDMGPIMGISSDGNLRSNTNYVRGGYNQSQLSSHFAPAQHWQTQTQPHFETQSLPPFKVFKRTHGQSQGQAQQSVVSPPGQENFQPIYMKPPGTVQHRVQGPAIAQSKQGQYAQNTLFPHPQNQAYPMNDLSGGGLSFQNNQQKLPEESTGKPVEVTWPLTPESIITDMIDNMTSDEESVKSPVENEEPMQSGGLMEFLPSPQSPWQTSSPQHSPYTEPSVASSLSPQHSPYQDPQGSPLQRVPDNYAPWTPESNVGSPGESLPPGSPTYNIHSTMGLTTGIMTVQGGSSLAPRAPNKQEIEDKRIHEIKTMLMTDSDPSQSPPHFYPGLPQQGRQFQDLQYQMDPCTPMPPVSPPTPVIPTSFVTHQQTPSQMYPPEVTPYIGELEAFKALVAVHSVEELLEQDDDGDTVLHLSICKEKVALSVAIIERLWMENRNLDILNKLHQTPLYLSVVCKLPILTEILINYRANLTIGNKEGNTPLHSAAMTGNTEAVKTIFRCMYRGYTFPETCKLFDATNFKGKTALMLAVEAHCESVNCIETVKELLMSNANPMFPDCQSGKTALHYAVELQKMDLIYILLEECQDASKLVNAKMYNGNTALHLIVGRAIPETHILHIVGILMSRGANVSISNDANEKPCDLVRREHCQVKHHLHGQEHHKR